MPSLSQITANFFVGLINRLGVRPPPGEAFLLSNIVQPVSIVDSDVVLTSVVSTLLVDIPFTGGEIVNPAGASVLVDSGAVALAGNYAFQVVIGSLAAGNMDFRVARRNAANSADIWSQLFTYTPNANNPWLFAGSIVLLASERLRVVVNTAVASTYQGSIWLQKLG